MLAHENTARKPIILNRNCPWPNILCNDGGRLCKRLEIEDCRYHDLRHEDTSRLFERRLTIPQVAVMTCQAGWRSLKRYATLKVEDRVTRLNNERKMSWIQNGW